MNQDTEKLVSAFKGAQSALVLQSSDFSLATIKQMVETKSINPSPGYQRRQRWSVSKQSALIESFLLNIPVPPVYLAEETFGQYTVIDGKQRLTSIADFMNGNFRLKGLDKLPEANGLLFSELPDPLRNALEVRPYIRIITLLSQSSPQLKYDVFIRLNTGGDSLLPQEIRNVAYSGPLNDLLFELSKNKILKTALKIKGDKSPAYAKMLDVEMVLRFFALRDSWKNFSGSYKTSLNSYANDNRFLSAKQLNELERLYRTTLDSCMKLWGDALFKRPNEDGKSWRDQFLSAMYDAQMIAVSELSANKLNKAIKRAGAIKKETVKLFSNDENFYLSVTRATNNAASVRYRIDAIKSLLN